MEIDFRKAKLSDIKLLLEIYKAAYPEKISSPKYPGNFTHSTLLDMFLAGYEFSILYIDGEPVGSQAHIRLDKETVWTTLLCVIPSEQKKGYAERIFKEQERIYRAKGFKAVKAKTLRTAPERVKRFYETVMEYEIYKSDDIFFYWRKWLE